MFFGRAFFLVLDDHHLAEVSEGPREIINLSKLRLKSLVGCMLILDKVK